MYAKLLKQSDTNTYIVNSSTLSPDNQMRHSSHNTIKMGNLEHVKYIFGARQEERK
jgi:hypothetical protein